MANQKLKQMVHDQQEAEKNKITSHEIQEALKVSSVFFDEVKCDKVSSVQVGRDFPFLSASFLPAMLYVPLLFGPQWVFCMSLFL